MQKEDLGAKIAEHNGNTCLIYLLHQHQRLPVFRFLSVHEIIFFDHVHYTNVKRFLNRNDYCNWCKGSFFVSHVTVILLHYRTLTFTTLITKHYYLEMETSFTS